MTKHGGGGKARRAERLAPSLEPSLDELARRAIEHCELPVQDACERPGTDRRVPTRRSA